MKKPMDAEHQIRTNLNKMAVTCQPGRAFDGTEERVLYRGPENAPLRVTTLVSLACMLASLALATIFLFDRASLGHGEMHSDRFEHGVGALVTTTLFAVLSFFLWRYARMIVCRIVLLPGGLVVRVSSTTLVGRHHREIALSSLSLLEPHRGDQAGEEAFSGSWLKILVDRDRSMLIPLDGSDAEMNNTVRSLRHLCFQEQKRPSAAA